MRTLHARARFSARMRGRSTRERDFRRECEDVPRESAIFSENARTLHARTRFRTRIFASRAANPARRTAVFTGGLTILLFYYFSNSTVTALANKNARTLYARARFSARMRGRSTRERDFRRECEDAPRESAIFSENARTLHARARFSARMRGRFTRERNVRRECEDALRESAISGENVRTLHARARFSARMRGRSTRERDFQREFLYRRPPTLHVGSPFLPVTLLFYYFSNSTVTALANKNTRTLHARALFSARMRGRSTRERDFRRECEDAPRESAISGENVRMLHARARFSARMRGRSTRERDFRRECEDAPRESAIIGENARTLHARTRIQTLHCGPPTLHVGPPFFTDRLTILLFYYFSTSTVTRSPTKMRGSSTRESDFQRECEDAPRESAISSENVRTLYARARFPARM